VALQNLARKIIGNVYKLVGDNPTDGAALGAAFLSGAWEIYNYFKASPEVVNTLSKAFNGTLPSAKKRELQEELNQQGKKIIKMVNCLVPNSYLPCNSSR
jgi:hypothetical protein